jgi:type III secretion system export apparatus protein
MLLLPIDAEVLTLIGGYTKQAILGMARIGACFAWIPYLSSGAIPSKLTRSVLALTVLIGIWPATALSADTGPATGMLLALCVEALIGTVIGLTVSLPFLVFHGFGAMVDNQRGASVSSMLDPLSGIEATELANLLQMFSLVIFLASGGLTSLLEVVHGSYRLVPTGGGFVPDLGSVHTYMGTLLAAALRMAAPVLLLLLVLELFLGVLSRFAQQMNAFSVSLTVKSFVAFLALLVYLMPAMVTEVDALWQAHSALDMLGPARPGQSR